MSPHSLSLAEAAALIAARKLSPVELLEDCLKRIAALDPRLNAFVRMTVEEAEAFIRADVARNAELRRLANFQPE